MNFAEYLKREMAARGWSQSELARRADCSRQYIHQIFQDDIRAPKLDTARQFARALGVTLDEMALELYGDEK